MSRGRSHRSDCQQPKNCKASHDVAHCTTSSEEDRPALRQMLVGDVAELRCLQGYRCREGGSNYAAACSICARADRPPGRCRYNVLGAHPSCCATSVADMWPDA